MKILKPRQDSRKRFEGPDVIVEWMQMSYASGCTVTPVCDHVFHSKDKNGKLCGTFDNSHHNGIIPNGYHDRLTLMLIEEA
jgi:hypothetical protein